MSTRRILSCILLPAYLSSCTAWHVQSASPEQVITEDQPSKIRVTLTDGSALEMEQPRIVGDTLRGMVKGGVESSPGETAVHRVLVERDVLLADIATVRVKKTDAAGTVLLVLVPLVALVVLASTADYDYLGANAGR